MLLAAINLISYMMRTAICFVPLPEGLPGMETVNALTFHRMPGTFVSYGKITDKKSDGGAIAFNIRDIVLLNNDL